METYFSHSADETFQIGKEFGRSLPLNSTICFFGNLAAGKTTFIKGLAQGAAQIDPSHVQSPTFTYLHIYEGTKTIYHFDLYRLRDSDEFLSMGFDEYFDAGGICCVEWSEKIPSCLPFGAIHVLIEHEEGDKRRVVITK